MVDGYTGRDHDRRRAWLRRQVACVYDWRVACFESRFVGLDSAEHRGRLMNSYGAAIGLAGLFVVNTAFNAFAPVTVGMSLQDATRTGDVVKGHVFGRKIKDCAVVPDSFFGWQHVGGAWQEVPFSFPDDPSPNSTRPDTWEVQDFGLWRWDGVAQDADRLKVSVLHSCRGDLTITSVTFDLP